MFSYSQSQKSIHSLKTEQDYQNLLRSDFELEGVKEWGSFKEQYELELMREVFNSLREIMQRRAGHFINVDLLDLEIKFVKLHNSDSTKEKFDSLMRLCRDIIQSVWVSTDRDECFLHIAAQYKNVRIVDTLIREGADVSLKQIDGQTPLHCAAAFGNREMIELLLSAGASRTDVDERGRTPCELAMARKRNADIIELLKSPVQNFEQTACASVETSSRCKI